MENKEEQTENHFYTGVKEFHKAFGHPMHETPQPLNKELALKRAVWSAEELVEFLHASSKNQTDFLGMIDGFMDGVITAVKKSSKDSYPQNEKDRIVAQADAMVDELYFNQGTFVAMGVKPTPLFDIVQEANMNKLGADGKPILRESDKKIMKPEGWMENWAPEPRIIKEIERQLEKE